MSRIDVRPCVRNGVDYREKRNARATRRMQRSIATLVDHDVYAVIADYTARGDRGNNAADIYNDASWGI
jgi:hypothetical protein